MFDQPARVACGQCGRMTVTEVCTTCVIHFCSWHYGPKVSIHKGHDCAAFSLQYFQLAAQIASKQREAEPREQLRVV